MPQILAGFECRWVRLLHFFPVEFRHIRTWGLSPNHGTSAHGYAKRENDFCEEI
jgi:hypothetical protein